MFINMKIQNNVNLSGVFVIALLAINIFIGGTNGLLRPQDSETRDTKYLDGMWRFRIAPRLDPDMGFRESWYKQPLDQSCQDCDLEDVIPMPVPSSYQDITTNTLIRDHVGWAWYDRDFFVPSSWLSPRKMINLYFGSVHYHAMVYVNGNFVTDHIGGHLPFIAEDMNQILLYGKKNLITVAVNNTLTNVSLPQGNVQWKESDDGYYPPGYFTLEYAFDFLNYAGIHRSVILYTVPQDIRIVDVTIITTHLAKDFSNVTLSYEVIVFGVEDKEKFDWESGCFVEVLDLETHATSDFLVFFYCSE